MDDKKVTKKRHNKQHDARAASFKRIAKALRKVGVSKSVAQVFDDEAKLLRSMR